MKQIVAYIILIVFTLNTRSENPYPIYTGYAEESDLYTFRSFIICPDTIFYILWKDNNFYPPDLTRYNITDETLNKWRKNIEVLHIQPALIGKSKGCGNVISRLNDYDPIFADSSINYTPKKNPDSIHVVLNLPNNNMDLSISLSYSNKSNKWYLKKNMECLDAHTSDYFVTKDKKTISFNIPGDSKLLGYCIKPFRLYAQNDWGEFFGRIQVPHTDSDAIELFDSDITITLRAVNKYLFTEPFLRTSPIYISDQALYWKDQEFYIRDLEINSQLLQPYIDDYKSNLHHNLATSN